MLSKTLGLNDFIEESPGIWVATVLATTHQLGVGVTLCKMLKKDANGDYHNAVPTFTVEANGDIKIYANEAGIYRITILKTDTRDI